MVDANPTLRADTVGSLLRPAALRQARRAHYRNELDADGLRAAEDEAVRQAIALQERLGLEIVSDGELRRDSWIATVQGVLSGFSLFPGGPGWQWQGTDSVEQWNAMPFPFVTDRVEAKWSLAEREYPFLHEHATQRTKYTIPAPSFHRFLWHAAHSRQAYPRCEDFLVAMRDYIRSEAERLVALGCAYLQLDAPNYGNLCDPVERTRLAAVGHDLDAAIAFDAELDSSVFDGLPGITRALHVCRGNAAGNWAASGGYQHVAADLFPRLKVDRLLLEYDTPRAGDFSPLAHVAPDTTAVLGLVTTKGGELETAERVEQRIQEATAWVPLERLALSPQCGFASVARGNPLTPEAQEAKLRLVIDVAQRVWG
ncbi:MAG: cobalamin-independent methionine synthase II family protein [Candidatus Tectomicrobia bacterium]